MGHEDIKTTLNVYGHLLKRVPAKTNPTQRHACDAGNKLMWRICGEHDLTY